MLATDQELPVLCIEDAWGIGSGLGEFTPEGCAAFKHRSFPWNLKKQNHLLLLSTVKAGAWNTQTSTWTTESGCRMNATPRCFRGEGEASHTLTSFELFRSRRQKQLGYEKSGWKPLTWSNTRSFSQVKTTGEPFRKETCGKILIKAEVN